MSCRKKNVEYCKLGWQVLHRDEGHRQCPIGATTDMLAIVDVTAITQDNVS